MAAGAIALAAAVVPSGPAFADSIRDQQWYLQSLKVAQAQAITKGAGVTVAVIDTGVSPHQDYRSNLLQGFDWVQPGNGQNDTNGHGTKVAAVLAAHGHAGSGGVLGIAPDAKILPMRPGQGDKAIDYANEVAKAIDQSIARGASVINISLGGPPDFDMIKSISDAGARNVVVVAGAGNRPDFSTIPYPGIVDGVLTVGATDRSGKHVDWSVTGKEIEICAPGAGIETATLGNQYANVNGTSFSTAIVSGAVALIRAKFPNLTAKEVVDRITSTADDIGPPGKDDECGYGELNIVKALTADIPSTGGSSGAATPSSSASDTAAGTPPTDATTPPQRQAEPAADDSTMLPIVIGALAVLVILVPIFILLVRRRTRS